MKTNRNYFLAKTILKVRNLYNSNIQTPPYLELEEYFPESKVLEENWEIIRDEIMAVIEKKIVIPKFHEIDKGQKFISNNDGVAWNILGIKFYDMWHPDNVKLCPKTCALLGPLKKVKTINFSILAPKKHIPPHKGPYKGIIRYQLALKVPKEGNCVLYVDDEPYQWTEGKGVLFDDTYMHEVRNDTNETRIALLLDIKREKMGFVMGIFDRFFYRIIQLGIILNSSFKKSKAY